MGDEMARQFRHLRLSRDVCLGLREAIRPLSGLRKAHAFCVRLYLGFYRLESDPDLETVDLEVDEDDLMIINQFVSAEEGDWAKDVLHQTRQVLYELTTGREAVRLASSQDAAQLFEGVNLDPDATRAEGEEDEGGEAQEAKV